MKYVLFGILVAVLMATSIMATPVAPNHPRSFDLKADGNGCYVDGGYWMTGWGVPGAAGGFYGGESYSNFCLVWEPSCAQTTESASVDLQFNGGSEKIVIRHLDGQSNLDSFDVKVSGVTVGHYTDSLQPTEDWVVTEFPVNGYVGNYPVALVATDSAWPSCTPWGQIAVDYINVETIEIPEFGTIAALVALMGSVVGLVVLRKKL